MSMFKDKKKKQIKSDNNSLLKTTIDAKHNKHIEEYNKENKNIEKYRTQLDIYEKEYRLIIQKPMIELSDKEISKKFNLKDEIEFLKLKITNIEKDVDINEYYMNTAHILYHYYEKKNTFQKIIKPQHKSRNKTVVDFFRTNDISNNQNEDEDALTDEDENSSKYDNMTKSALFMRYMNFTIPDYICDFDDTLDNICEHCDIEKKILPSEGVQICPKCGSQTPILIDYDKPSYKDPPKEISYFAYKRINHFNEWLAQFQAKESTEIPKEVYDKVKIEIIKEKIPSLTEVSPEKLREILKKLKFNKYYEHVPHILNRLNGIPAPVMSREIEEKLRTMFREIQTPFLKHCPKNRKNFLSYSYVLHKFAELLELDEYLVCFPLLKSKDKLHEQDNIWRKICEELHWEFYKSV